MSITIKEIADRANVSIATVSRALNSDQKVKQETRDLVISIAKELNYKPNIMARSLVKNKSNIIGVVLPEVDGEYFSEIVHGIDEIVSGGGFHTIVASSHSQRSIVESMLSFMGESFVRGVILITPSISERIREIVEQSTLIPTIIINSHPNLTHIDSVAIDNYQGAFSMVEYLIKNLGYKKIAHIKGPPVNDDASQREKGYLDALSKNNIPLNKEWLINGDFTIESGNRACMRLLNLIDKPEVIFAANDMMALGCYKAIKSIGYKIPDDIGVVGFDDIFLSEYLTPRLTTVHVPIVEIGKTAAEILLDRLTSDNGKNENKNGGAEIKNIKISTGLVIGGSCRAKSNSA